MNCNYWLEGRCGLRMRPQTKKRCCQNDDGGWKSVRVEVQQTWEKYISASFQEVPSGLHQQGQATCIEMVLLPLGEALPSSPMFHPLWPQKVPAGRRQWTPGRLREINPSR